MKAFLATDAQIRRYSEQERTSEGSSELDPESLWYELPSGELVVQPTKKRFSRTYYVTLDPQAQPVELACNMTPDNAMEAKGVPQKGQVIGGATCIGQTAKEVDSIKPIWIVTCYFDDNPPVPQEFIWYWDDETIEKVVERDPITNVPIVNTVGEPLFMTRPETIQVLTIERVEWQKPNGMGPRDMPTKKKNEMFGNKVNQDMFWGHQPKVALMQSIRDVPFPRGGFIIRKVTYVIKFNQSKDQQGVIIGWGVELLNHGSKHRIRNDQILPDGRTIPASNKFETFKDGNKNPTTGNLNLDGTYRDPALSPLYLKFNRFPWVDFGFLDLEVLVF